MESMQLPLENVINTIFYASNDFGKMTSEVQLTLRRIFEGLPMNPSYQLNSFSSPPSTFSC